MFRLIRALTQPALRPMLSAFEDQLRHPRESQQRLLKKLIASLSATEYGRALKVKAGDDYQTFAARAPIAGYDALSSWIERQRREEGSVLVAEPVLFYEKTSGSSGPAKYIPYTRGLKSSFNRMFLIWLGDLLRHGPRFETGKVWISVSPALQSPEATARGIRVGLDDDAEYLTRWMQFALKPLMALPPEISRLRDPTAFKHVLATLLLAAGDLEIISIWNPSLLTLLLDYIQANREALAADVEQGRLVREGVTFKFPHVSKSRLARLRESRIRWVRLWPRLKLISCWTSAQAVTAARGIGHAFPGVCVQGKGLLATEAPLTLPLIEAHGYVPLPSEVFYEFLDDQGRVSLLHELEAGREYEIVLTQRGGLTRYRIGDVVRVTHFYRAAPCLEFQGRRDAVCDLVGEKLSEGWVRACLAKFPFPPDGFQIVLPVESEHGPSYYLLVADCLPDSPASFAESFDEALSRGYHYRYARQLGQLEAVKVCLARRVREAYYDYFMNRGMKWGDIKHRYLIQCPEEAAKLRQWFSHSMTV